MSTRVGVIIPTFNRAPVLEEALRSALRQTQRSLEIIVVDDGSTDGTAELVSSIAGGDPRIRYHAERQSGAAAARNAGLAIATSDLIAFLDSDDHWEPWHLEAAIATLDQRSNVGLVWTDAAMIDAAGGPVPGGSIETILPAYRFLDRASTFRESVPVESLWPEAPTETRGGRVWIGDAFSQMILGNIILTSSVVMRREVAERVGRFDERWHVGEDYDFFLRACRETTVAFIEVPSVRYRIGRADKLARRDNALEMAQAYLAVLDRTLQDEGDRIHLGPGKVRMAVAHAHRWIGELELAQGNNRGARGGLMSSLRARPWQPALVAMLALTFVPGSLLQRMLRARRALLGRPAT